MIRTGNECDLLEQKDWMEVCMSPREGEDQTPQGFSSQESEKGKEISIKTQQPPCTFLQLLGSVSLAVPFSLQLPFSLQIYTYCLYLKSLSVSISLICHFIMMKYVQALFPSPFGTVFQRKTRLTHCSPVLTVKLSLVIKLSTLLLPNKLSKSLCDC